MSASEFAQLGPPATARHAESVVVPRCRRGVEHGEHRSRRTRRVLAQPGVHALVGVGALDPLQTGRVAVTTVHAGLVGVETVDVGEPPADADVTVGVVERPVERRLVVPLLPRRQLAAHEQQLLARLRPLHRVQQPQVRELLPVVAGHLAQQRSLAVDDLVVAERQHEVLAGRVDRAERDLAVVPAAVDRVASRSTASVSCIQPMSHLNPNPSPPM